MVKFTKTSRRFAAGFLAANLSIAALGASAVVAPVGAEIIKGSPHNFWRGYSEIHGNHPWIGVETELKDGGSLGFFVDNEQISLILTNENWDLYPGNLITVLVEIDGQFSKVQGMVTDAHTIKANHIYPSFVGQFVHGEKAKVDIGGSVLWTLDLYGFKASLTEMMPTSTSYD